MNDYEERIERRRERLLDRADATKAQAHALINQAHQMASVIPFGQPILVGHHSEGRDRRYRSRIHDKFTKGHDLAKHAEEIEQRAAAVGTGGISSDDPNAIEKLKEKLAACRDEQDKMKRANALVRANDRTGLVNMGFPEEEAARLLKGDFIGRRGFAGYQFTNNNAEIHRLERRIAELEQQAQRQDKEEDGNGYTYREDTAENRVMFFFPGKPSESVRALLKFHAFKFSPSRNNAWVRQLNANGLFAAKIVRQKLDAMEGQ